MKFLGKLIKVFCLSVLLISLGTSMGCQQDTAKAPKENKADNGSSKKTGEEKKGHDDHKHDDDHDHDDEPEAGSSTL